MEIHVQAINFTADQKLIEYVNQKAERLSRLLDRIQRVEIFLKLEEKHSHIKQKSVEIKVSIPGNVLFASESEKTFEKAFDEALGSIKKQLRKQKSKWEPK